MDKESPCLYCRHLRPELKCNDGTGLYVLDEKYEQPLIVLEREGTGEHLADLGGVIRIHYQVASGEIPLLKLPGI